MDALVFYRRRKPTSTGSVAFYRILRNREFSLTTDLGLKVGRFFLLFVCKPVFARLRINGDGPQMMKYEILPKTQPNAATLKTSDCMSTL
jgi:hypothetical protein